VIHLKKEIVLTGRTITDDDLAHLKELERTDTVSLKMTDCIVGSEIDFDELTFDEIDVERTTFKKIYVSNIVFENEVFLRDCTFDEVVLDDCKFEQELYVNGCRLLGLQRYVNTVFDKDVSFSDSEFEEEIHLDSCEFRRKTYFSECFQTPEDKGNRDGCRTVLKSKLDSNNTAFTDMVVFSGATFLGGINMTRTTFANDLVVSAHTDTETRTVIRNGITFSSCALQRNLFAYGSDIDGFHFLYSTIGGNIMFSHRISDDQHLNCRADRIEILESDMSNDVVLYGSEIDGDLTIKNSSIGGDLMISRLDNRVNRYIPSTVRGNMVMSHCTVGSYVLLQGCVFEGTTDIYGCTFESRFICMDDVNDPNESTVFKGAFTCKESVFEDNVLMFGCVFEDKMTIENSVFSDDVNFAKTDIGKTVIVPSVFKGEMSLLSCTFSGLVYFFGCIFEAKCSILFGNFSKNVMFATTMKKEDGLSFVGCEFRDIADFSESHFMQDLSMYGSDFQSDVFLPNITVGKDFILSRVRTDRGCSSITTFHGIADFKSSHFMGMVYIENIVFEKEAFFKHTIFEREVYFSNILKCSNKAGYSDRFNISSMSPLSTDADTCASDTHLILGTVFNDRAVFDYAEFKGAVWMYCCRLSSASFRSTLFRSDVHFNNFDMSDDGCLVSAILDDVDFSKSIFEGICHIEGVNSKDRLVFDDATFEKSFLLTSEDNVAEVSELSFVRAIFEKDARLDGMKASKDCSFDDAYVNGSLLFSAADYRNKVSFRNGKVFGTVDITTAGDIDLSECIILGSLSIRDGFGKLNLEDSKIYGQVDVNWTYLSENNYEHLSKPNDQTFRMLKENYSRIGRYDEEDSSYVQYKNRHVKEGHHFGIRHSVEKLFGFIGGYGTSPISIGIAMIVAVFLFALIYTFVPGIEFNYTSLPFFDSLYLSTMTFLTMGPAEFVPSNEVTRTVIVVEGFAGLFSMFYFTLAFARKILR